MQYLRMLPYQVRKAIENNTPAVLPLGVIEYHAEHLPLGTDCFTCIEAIRRVEEKHPEMVVLPPFYYGCASMAVASPEQKGTVHVDGAHIIPVAEDIFRGLLRVGFRNIHAFIAHQTEEFGQGMPTDLSFRFAARHVIFEWLEKESGEGWWGSEKFASYYSGNNNPFAWIQVHPIRCGANGKKVKADHAGRTETSEVMKMYPELVELDRIDGSLWFAREGKNATAEFGDFALQCAALDIEELLFNRGDAK